MRQDNHTPFREITDEEIDEWEMDEDEWGL